jgi:hypothetical protein
VSERNDLRELLGDDVTDEELERLARVDELLRSVPGPPAQVPAALTARVRRLAAASSPWTRRRTVAAIGLAAALAALTFGIGRWTASEDAFSVRRVVPFERTDAAPGNAWARVELGPRDDASGNWQFELDIGGLPPLEGNGYYVLWLEKDGEWGATCGTFNVGEDATTVRLSASYRLRDFDAWVVTAHPENEPEDAELQPLLRAPTT